MILNTMELIILQFSRLSGIALYTLNTHNLEVSRIVMNIVISVYMSYGTNAI